MPFVAWNVSLISIFLERSLVFPILLFSSIYLHCSFKKAFLSLLALLWNSVFSWVCACLLVAQLGLTLYDPWTAALQWVALPFPRGSSKPRDLSWVSCTPGRSFTIWATRETPIWACLSLSPLFFFLLFFPQLFVKPPQTTTLPSCFSISWGWFWSLPPVQCYEPLFIVLHILCLPDLISWIYFSPPMYKGFYLGHTWWPSGLSLFSSI